MNRKRIAWGMGTLATLLLAGNASAGQGVHLEFKDEAVADRLMLRDFANEFQLGNATRSKGVGVHLEFKHERLADRPQLRVAVTQTRLGGMAVEKGEGVELLLRRESFEPRARRARVAPMRRFAADNGSLEQICQDIALPEFVAVILGVKGACN